MPTNERLGNLGSICLILIFIAFFAKLTLIANLLIFVFLLICILSNIQQDQENKELARRKIEWEKRNQERLIQKQHEEEQRKLEEKKQKEEEKIVAIRLAEARYAEEYARTIYEQEAKKQKAILELEVNAKNLLLARPPEMSKLDFAKVSKIEFIRFSEGICQEANDYYKIQSLAILKGEYLEKSVDPSHITVEDIQYPSKYSEEPHFKKYFRSNGSWKGISFNAFISYIRHNYTNYEFLLLDVSNDITAYDILKLRVNKLIISILTLIANMSDPESFIIKDMNQQSIDSWNWDVQTKENLKSKYANFRK
ncbi:hypothetical protein [Nostoc sp.]|uniref:hypothetical protein n=1 Tax=Nostoc sp. TaxID=1180 RepID=UPI002FF68BF5